MFFWKKWRNGKAGTYADLGGFFQNENYVNELLLRQCDSLVGNTDLSFFVEPAGGHFERLFAHAEEGIDIFRAGPVMVR